MRKNWLKPLSTCMACLVLTFLLSGVTQTNSLSTSSSSKTHIILTPDEDAPWM